MTNKIGHCVIAISRIFLTLIYLGIMLSDDQFFERPMEIFTLVVIKQKWI